MKTTPIRAFAVICALLASGPLVADSIVTTDAFLPVVHIVGATGIYRSDVSVFNPSSTQSAEVRFYFGAADTNGSNGPAFRITPDLAPRETVTLEDILPNYFQISSGYGLLEVRSTIPVITSSNTLNVQSNCTGGTFGQFSPGQPERNSVGFGTTNDYDLYVAGLLHDVNHRTNAVIMNPSSQTLHATMQLVSAGGSTFGHADVDVPPYSLHQFNDVFHLFGAPYPDNGNAWRLNFYVNTNNGATLLAYATLSDIRSGDPYLIPAQAQLVNVPAIRPVPDGSVRPPAPSTAPFAIPEPTPHRAEPLTETRGR